MCQETESRPGTEPVLVSPGFADRAGCMVRWWFRARDGELEVCVALGKAT